MDISASQFGSNEYAQAVEAQIGIAVFQADTLEEVEPSLRRTLWGAVSLRATLGTQLTEKGYKCFVEPRCVRFAALCSKRDAAILNVNFAHGVEMSFGKSAALIPRNLKAVGQKCPQWLRLFCDALSCYRNLSGIEIALGLTANAAQPQIAAWIGLDVPTKYSLLQNDSKSLNLQKRSVVPGTIFTNPDIWTFAPLEIRLNILAGQARWGKDFAFCKKHPNCAPCCCVSKITLRLVAVAISEKVGYPRFPSVGLENSPVASFRKGAFSAEFLCYSGVFSYPNLKASGLVADFSGLDAVLNPPKRAVSSPVNRRHKVSPTVTT